MDIGYPLITMDNMTYLAVANAKDDTNLQEIPSRVYRFNVTTQQFDVMQEIDTQGAAGFKAFTMDNDVMHLA